MQIKKIQTNKAPQAVGPYSQAIQAGGFVFCSGQIPIDPNTNTMIDGGIEKETEQVLDNLKEVLKGSGSSLGKVVRTDIFLTDINDFQKVNEIYGRYFKNDPLPVRQTVCVKSLPKGAKVEISAIAIAGKGKKY